MTFHPYEGEQRRQWMLAAFDFREQQFGPSALRDVAAQLGIKAEGRRITAFQVHERPLAYHLECRSGSVSRRRRNGGQANSFSSNGYVRHCTSLGLPAVLPPPEEVKKVETAIGAARAENQRDEMLKSKH